MGLAASRPENKDRRFRDAACEGNLARMRTELKHPSGEPDVNAPDARGMTALNLAVLGNHVEAAASAENAVVKGSAFHQHYTIEDSIDNGSTRLFEALRNR